MYLRKLASTFFSGRLGSLSWHRGRDSLISLLNPPDLFSRRSTYLYTLSACSAGPSSACCCSQQQSSRPQTFTRSSEVSPLPLFRQPLPSLADQRAFSLVPPVDRQANDATIKKAYRKIAKANHPDKNKDPAAQQKFADASNGTRADYLLFPAVAP